MGGVGIRVFDSCLETTLFMLAFGALFSAYVFSMSLIYPPIRGLEPPNAQVKMLPPLFIGSLVLDKLTNFTICVMHPKTHICNG